MLKPSESDHFPTIFLKAGEIYLAESPCLISTVLGSCIAVTMHCPEKTLGAMCHGLLPARWNTTPASDTDTHDFRYVDSALRYMLKQFDRRGIDRTSLKIKMFGGADVLTPPARRRWSESVGQKNIEAARRFFRQEGLRLNASRVGGIQGHKIVFNTRTGEVFLKMLRPGGWHNPSNQSENGRFPQ